MESKNNSKNLNDKTYYIENHSCNFCNCINSYSYDYCQCSCHKDKFQDNYDMDFENGPNLNINELKMKSLKEYSYKNQNLNFNNNYPNQLKHLISSKSSANIEKFNNNGKHLLSLKKRIDNHIENIKISCMNRPQEANYLNSQKNLQLNYKINNKNENTKDIGFKEVASHYQTQKSFNLYQRYFQFSNNINTNNFNCNNSLKSQIEFNKLLNSIKGNDNNLNNNISINNINVNNSNIKYNTYTERRNNNYTKLNGNNNSPLRTSNNSYYEKIPRITNYNNNIPRNTVNYNRNNRILEKYKENNSNFNDFCSNTEYNKPFRPLNIDNGNSLNFNDKNINNNTSIQIPSNIDFKPNNLSSRTSFIENNISNINQNGGNSFKDLLNTSKKLKLDEDSISYNSSTINKSYNKLCQDTDKNSNNNYNKSYTEPRYSNTSKNTENDNVNIQLNYLETNNSHNENENELLESKDINGENNNNFIVTFGAKGNNEIKNIIASVKNELNNRSDVNNNNRDNKKRSENTDQKINKIIIDYENLKKRYAPNKLFIGLQNNIKDLNENISINNNIILDNCSNKSTINTSKNNIYSQYKFDLFLKGDSEKNKKYIEENENYKKEINSLNNELTESKNKINELMSLVNNYQKEIYSLKNQLSNSKKDALNESRNTFNNISTSNINIHSSNKTKIGKDSFIIKIPESIIRNNLNFNKKSRNNSLSSINNNKNNNTFSNIIPNTNRNMQDKHNNIFNNFGNISNISNNYTNSNCFTNNNNISNSNISGINNEVYVKKITTTMKKKIKKSASQKLRINKDLSLNLMNKELYNRRIEYSSRNNNINNKLIYTLYQKDNRQIILSFDIIKKQFNYINFSDNDNFTINYFESFRDRGDNLLNSNSIYSINNIYNNFFYIVTGKNSDILYKYNNESKFIKKLCKFNNNHAKGCLLFHENKIFCLSGYHNKKAEMFLEEDNTLINLEEMNIERCNFSACIVQNKYILALFGYNYPTKQNLDSIEFYEIKSIDNYQNSGWKYLNYRSNNLLNLNIEGHICFNYNDEKIIFFGGFNDENKAVDGFYELMIDGYDFNDEYSNRGIFINKIDKDLNDIYKNRCYFFGNNNGFLFKDINNNLIFTAFDNNSFVHILEVDNMMHNICYLE